jgi:hypothetical protein
VRGPARAKQWIRHVARDQRPGQQGLDHVPEAGAPVHRCAVPEPDDEPGRTLILRCDDELAEPSARRPHRVELVSTEAGDADCSRCLDDSPPVGEKREARFNGPPERVGDRRRPPIPAKRGAERLRRSFSAVGHRGSIHLNPRPRQTSGQRACRRRRAENALERARADNGSGAVRNLAYRWIVGSNDIALLTAAILGISIPITLALLVPHYHLDSVVLFSIPCGLVAGSATAVLAASDRRRAGKPVNGGVVVAYGALALLGAGILLLTVAAIAFYRTPLTF